MRDDRITTIMNADDQFEALVKEHYEPLFRFAMNLTRAEADAWDLTQHTFHVWATKGHQLRDISKVKTWLFTTLHRAFLLARRKQIRFPHQDLEEVSEQLPAPSPALSIEGDSAPVLTALGRVDDIYRAAVALFYLEDRSYQDIAAVLDVPVGTVKSRIARGIAQLREIVGAGSPCLSSRDEGRTSSGTGAHEPAARQERTVPASHRRFQWATGGVEGGVGEWDLSSTSLREPIAPV